MSTLVSFVVPIYNEEENVRLLYQELSDVARDGGIRAEFIFIDDGSRDETPVRLREVADSDERVKVIELRRNFGQTAAMAAGFDYCDGEIVVTLDGDLQNDPHEVPRMIQKLEEGYDIVAGWRKNRQDKVLSRIIPSMIANRIISKTTKVTLHDYGCSLKVFRAEVVKNIKLYGEMHRFIPAVAAQMGVKICEIPVNHRARQFGVSKYGISRTLRVILDLLTVQFFLGFATRPLHLFGMLGLGTGALGTLLLAVLSFERLVLGVPLSNRPILLVGVMLVLIGLQFICSGLLAEVLVRTYHESQGKKIYTVRNVYRRSNSTGVNDDRAGVRVISS
ncbi:MAG TPA: glycosyltransferase family 2 protein [Oligoflexia bacterium]|nr:glycosyltransferase family 2 protein [Oligoflexia bacterium]HMP47096.1 glycosyltransferase family 2 protein [Oligoflexia bacterium]